MNLFGLVWWVICTNAAGKGEETWGERCFPVGGGIVEFMAEMLIERRVGQGQVEAEKEAWQAAAKLEHCSSNASKFFCNFKKVASGRAKWKSNVWEKEGEKGRESCSWVRCVRPARTHTHIVIHTHSQVKVWMKTLLSIEKQKYSNVCGRFKQFCSRQLRELNV